ncbi:MULTISPECIES: hypothetical protein [Vibrio]|jgi:Ser-tRNA(Ala) deacylase AlaX|uniref:hypothetical protein n=1 Tax=Vibrio TaxID=662 RepID=UPI001EE04C8A|nr:hypothetical protein [Vibrio cincinnatiensis]MCG3734552.1 hypothetical protein [Vibrio cincinnatiensis]MCG3736493.1 hypothetical protein [Vibrio cincinnatiensis]MCG3739709.1 hypothetical protein [Vibrio cincinnatiensis]
MSYKEITPEQARANSNASTYGTKEILKSVYHSIEAVSKTGATSIVKYISSEAGSKEEIDRAAEKLKLDGYNVECTLTAANTALKVSW